MSGIIFCFNVSGHLTPESSKLINMVTNRYFLFLLAFTSTAAFSQYHQETHSRVSKEGFSFINGANDFNRLSANCGIYRTANDRQKGRLSLAIDCKSEDHRIKPGFIREKSTINVVRQERAYRYLKRDLYGYRDCRGREYHFFNGNSYQLVNPGESIAIYRVFEKVGKQQVVKYFFSSESTAVKPLTLENLRLTFVEEPLFLEKLHLLARNDFQLIKYLYAINRIRMNASQGV